MLGSPDMKPYQIKCILFNLTLILRSHLTGLVGNSPSSILGLCLLHNDSPIPRILSVLLNVALVSCLLQGS